MRLISVQVAGYKRFAEPVTLWVTSPLIAVVGPNEAGKTSLLEAMRHLSRDAQFSRSEYTDRREPNDEPSIVSARYAVESADKEVAGGLLEADTDYTLTLAKSAGYSRAGWSLEPALYRDLEPRRDAIEHLRRIVEAELLVEPTGVGDESDEEVANTELSDQAESIADRLEGADEDLTSTALEALQQFIAAVRGRYGEEPPTAVAELLARLDQLHEHEAEENPHERAGTLLARRTSAFLLFEGEHRTLQTNYEWAEHETAPAALANLCHLADLDYAGYRMIALDRDRRDELQTLERAANANLGDEFAAWTQEELSVVFRADHEGLQLQVFDKKTLRDVPFDQRSAGLRYFVALVAFTARYAAGRPAVLLIDEAEVHLHYGGQADLIQVFERQTVAQTIIYTIHSIGCLPEDLGTSIRAVEPIASERSVLRDSFWEGGAGLTPLMLAMGATRSRSPLRASLSSAKGLLTPSSCRVSSARRAGRSTRASSSAFRWHLVSPGSRARRQRTWSLTPATSRISSTQIPAAATTPTSLPTELARRIGLSN
jgi:energy-coupling factor transporter ATP-binding protein EcfA2